MHYKIEASILKLLLLLPNAKELYLEDHVFVDGATQTKFFRAFQKMNSGLGIEGIKIGCPLHKELVDKDCLAHLKWFKDESGTFVRSFSLLYYLKQPKYICAQANSRCSHDFHMQRSQRS